MRIAETLSVYLGRWCGVYYDKSIWSFCSDTPFSSIAFDFLLPPTPCLNPSCQSHRSSNAVGYTRLLSILTPYSHRRHTSPNNRTRQSPQRFTSVSCFSPSKQPSRQLSVSSNTGPGPSFLQLKKRVLAGYTSPTSFSVSLDLRSSLNTSLPAKMEGVKRMVNTWRALLMRLPSAMVLFVDMYGRVKAKLSTAGESSQKSKSS